MKLIGECSRCGECCSELIVPKDILDEKNIIDGKKYCKFAYKENNIFKCKILEKEKIKSPLLVIGTTESILIKENIKIILSLENRDVEFFESAIDFPNPNNPFFNPKHFNLKKRCPSCTYSID